jgi:hypothetical protein
VREVMFVLSHTEGAKVTLVHVLWGVS